MNRMNKTVVRVWLLMLLAVVSGCHSARKGTLYGHSREDILRTFGKPDEVSVVEAGYSTLQFTNAGLTAVFHDTELVNYVFSAPSRLTVDSGIGIGTPLSEVITRLGGYTNEQEVTEWFAGSAPAVLYHHAGHDRYKLNYLGRGLSIMFGPDRKAEVIWVGPMPALRREARPGAATPATR